jgi:hypothetical protein
MTMAWNSRRKPRGRVPKARRYINCPGCGRTLHGTQRDGFVQVPVHDVERQYGLRDGVRCAVKRVDASAVTL